MKPLRRLPQSLTARLMIGAVAWSLIVLVIGGAFLAGQYRRSVTRAIDADLQVVLDALVVSTEVSAAGVAVRPLTYDPRFNNPGSGRYWQVAYLESGGPPKPLARSDSLWDEQLPWPVADTRHLIAQRGEALFVDIEAGPFRQPVRLGAMIVVIKEKPLTFFAATDASPARLDAARFNRTLITALAVLAAGLIGMVTIQVLVGLAPLQRLRGDIADVRKGKKPRLDGVYPDEVAPLTSELNALLDHNRAVVERARTHVGNLAHALKTPLSVLTNEARAQTGPLAEIVARQTEAMGRNVDHYLQRAQAAARAETVGARTEVRPVLEDIARTLTRLYGRSKDMDVHVLPGAPLVFRGERNDLEEMAGNLMENACKYGGGVVQVSAIEEAGRLTIIVEDDGPGLSEDGRAAALTRGQRLDETAPGQGLGLSIVADLARLYGGELLLGDSALGGLQARLRLPMTD